MNKDITTLLQLLNKEGLTKLMKNKFGNYFIQGIIKKANYEQIKLILSLISDNFIEISKNISGTYVIQKLLNKINTKELRLFILKLIENRELEMAFNNNATYVLQKIIEKIPDTERIQLNEIIINNTFFLSLNPDCVFIVEKFINTISINSNKVRIINVIFIHCIQLSNNPYGNYLIQYILQIYKNDEIKDIHNLIIDNAYLLVQQRYASNVIEKCFEIFDEKSRKRMIINICLGGDILTIIKNQYGHYVLNKIIKYIDENIKIQIENILNKKMIEMNKKEKSKTKKFISILINGQFKKK
jgi:pumilio RNA-binding family